MQPSKLYVIGNGLDLWRGIPSSYARFKEDVVPLNRCQALPLESEFADRQA